MHNCGVSHNADVAIACQRTIRALLQKGVKAGSPNIPQSMTPYPGMTRSIGHLLTCDETMTKGSAKAGKQEQVWAERKPHQKNLAAVPAKPIM